MYRGVLQLIATAAAILALTGVSQATTYDLDLTCSAGTCTNQGVFGTVNITGGGTSLIYAFDVTDGGDLHQGGGNSIDALLLDVGGTISTTTFSNTSFSFSHDSSPNSGGLGTFTDAYTCTDPSSGGNACGAAVTVTFTGTNLVANFTTTNGNQIFAGADITCQATGASCSNDPNFATGSVGATLAATPLPAALPLFATGLGGLGLLGWRRKRKGQAVAA